MKVDAKKKIISFSAIGSLVDTQRDLGKKVALCHGVFDLVHPGHIEHFLAASKLADLLVVSITSDQYVNKGPGRPAFSETVRAEALAALSYVDFVVITPFQSAIEIVNQIKPHYYVKGADYLDSTKDVTGKIDEEKSAVQAHGGVIHFTNELTSSSSTLINKFLSPLSNPTRNWLEDFKNKNGYERVEQALQKISQLRVLILGEVIIDRYTTCEALSKSSKDPLLAFQLGGTRDFPGGVLAIANNCASWVSEAKVVSFNNEIDYPVSTIESMLNLNVALSLIESSDRPTIVKHRYIDRSSKVKVFESYSFSRDDISPTVEKMFVSRLKELNDDYDLVLVADYGHGMMTPNVRQSVLDSRLFVGINTQANAGNRGFNTISKYNQADFISMNGGELQLELRDRNPNFMHYVPELLNRMNARYALVTLGADGLIAFNSKGQSEAVPALASTIIDKVGAGDSVFAITSLLTKVEADLDVIGFLGNLVAAHEVSQFGHQKSLTIGDLLKQTKSILG
jgi:rfaE bifunctional protein nucleotidyltransferase chain/domain